MSGSRTSKALVNLRFSLLDRLLTVLLSFGVRTAFVQVFCAEYLGLNALFADVLNLLSMADLGLGAVMSVYLYRPLAEDDSLRLAALAGFYQRLYRAVAAAVTALGLCLVPLLPRLVSLERPVPHLIGYYLLSLAGLAASCLWNSRAAVLSADQRQYAVTAAAMAANTARGLAQLAAILYFKSYAGYLAAAAAGTALQGLLTARAAARRYPFLNQRAELSREDKGAILRAASSAAVYKACGLLLNATDSILISLLAGTAAVGLYANYTLLQTQLSKLFSLLFTSLTAGVGSLVVTQGPRRRYEVFRCQQAVSFAGCAVLVPCYVILAGEFIRLWLGEGYLMSDGMSAAVGLSLYQGCVLQPLWSYREATGLYTRTKWGMAACAGVNLVLSLVLGLRLGAVGVVLASSAARQLTYMWYEPRVLFREYFACGAGGWFCQLGQNALLTAGLTVGLGWVSRRIPALSWGAWLAKGTVLGVICLTAAIAVYGRTEEAALLRQRLGRRTRK